MRSAEPVDVPQRAAQGHAAVQRRAAVPRQLHVRQVARLRRLGGERRRRGRQPADGHRTSTRATARPGFDVRHRAVDQRGLGAAVGSGPPLAERGRRARRGRRRLAARRASATITTGRPFTVFMQTGVNNGAPSWPNRIGSGELDNPTVDLWFNPTDFVAPPANTYGNTGRGILYAPGAHEHRHVAVEALRRSSGATNVEFRLGRVQPVQPSRIRLPEPELRLAHGRTASRRRSVDNRIRCSSR